MKRQLELFSTSPVAEIWVTLTAMAILTAPEAIVLPLVWVAASLGQLVLARVHDTLVEHLEAAGVAL